MFSSKGRRRALDEEDNEKKGSFLGKLNKPLFSSMANGERVGEIKVDLMYPKSMVEQETDNLDFDQKRYEQARMQAHILLGKKSEAPQDYEAEIQRIKLLSELDAEKAVLREMILKELTGLI